MDVEPRRRPERPRDRVVLLLGLISSKDAQRRACASGGSREELAFELCRVWIEEVFDPSMSYLDGWKGDRDPEAERRFWAAFTEAEREALERFHRFVELRIEMLPEEARTRGAFPEGDRWDNLVRDASNTLEELEDDGEEVRERVERVVRRLVRDTGGSSEAPGAWFRRLRG